MTKKYLVFDTENYERYGFETLEEANKKAEDLLQSCRDEACTEGWSDELDIKVVKVLSRSVQIEREPVKCASCQKTQDDCQCDDFEAEHEWDYTCDYGMKGIQG